MLQRGQVLQLKAGSSDGKRRWGPPLPPRRAWLTTSAAGRLLLSGEAL